MCDSIEPLAPALWFQRIVVIATGELGSVENSLRHAAHLVQLAPISFRRVVQPILEESKFEAILEAGDFETAARHLVVPPATLTVESADVGQRPRAALACHILQRPVDGNGDTVAAAILDAWASRLIALRLEFGSELDDDAVATDRPRSARSKGLDAGLG